MRGERTAAAEDALSTRALSDREFDQISELARRIFGLELKKGKEELVAARLGKKLRELGMKSFRDYYQHVLQDSTGESLIGLIDALATNHTNFFREPAHFEFLRTVVAPQLQAGERLDIWSAACSTGEEPYSIAFSLVEAMGPEAYSRVRILATDISTRALDKARQGIYPKERLEGALGGATRSCLLRGEGRWAGWYRVKPEVVRLIEFRRLNLIEPFPALPKFRVIFCRNVMIYFSPETQTDLVNRLAGCLEPGGYLLVGHAESLNGIRHGLEYVKPATYRKPGGRREGGRKCHP